MHDHIGIGNPFEISHGIYPVAKCSTNPLITAAEAAE
jgi:hypothetical protein